MAITELPVGEILEDRLAGLLLGQAAGDAIGLPREGVSRGRASRMFAGRPLKQKLVLGKGMCSDDTEHACMTAVAILKAQGDPKRFASTLAWQMRCWFLSLPAGLGMATARSCIKLCLGFPAHHSGVWSAGNGPAMRATVIGAVHALQQDSLIQAVRISTRMTHTDPKAEEGALVVAMATAHSIKQGRHVDADAVMHDLLTHVRGEDLHRSLSVVRKLLAQKADVDQLVESLGFAHGVSGYINHTVPAAIYCWLSAEGDFQKAVETAVCLGGDADTTGAITGGIIGAGTGVAGIPTDWLDDLWEWPRNKRYMRCLAHELAMYVGGAQQAVAPRWCWPGVMVRNVVFLCIVLLHGLRRVFPPY